MTHEQLREIDDYLDGKIEEIKPEIQAALLGEYTSPIGMALNIRMRDRQIFKLRAALRFYAHEGNWVAVAEAQAHLDQGKRAREALQ